MSGFVAIARKIFQNPMFTGDAYSKREAFIYLIARADWHGERRGTFSCYLSELANCFGWSKTSVDRFLRKLENENVIGTVSGTKAERNRITYRINNYERYQTVNSSGDSISGTEAERKRNDERNSAINKDLKQNTTITKPKNTPLPPFQGDVDFEKELSIWIDYKKIQHRFNYKSVGLQGLYEKLLSFETAERAIAAMRHSRQSGWKGIFEPTGTLTFTGKQSNAEKSASMTEYLRSIGE